jgi:hypothetical protein
VEARPDCPGERREPAAAEVSKAVKDTIGTSVEVVTVEPETLAGRRESCNGWWTPGPCVTTTQDAAPARRGRPGHSRDTLLDVAVAVFNERGYDATSMEELAGRLGITKSPSTTTWQARVSCCGWRWTVPSTRCSP